MFAGLLLLMGIAPLSRLGPHRRALAGAVDRLAAGGSRCSCRWALSLSGMHNLAALLGFWLAALVVIGDAV